MAVPAWNAGDIPLPQRVARGERAQPGIAGKLLALLLLVILGAVAYLFQDRLLEEESALLASINARLTPEAPRTPAAPADAAPEPPASPVTAPVEAPAIAAAPLDLPAAPADIPAEPIIDAPTEPIDAPDAPVEIPEPASATAEAPAAGPSRFAFSQPVLTVSESDVAARIVIRRTGNLAERASIAWWTADGSAIADQDFADLGRRIERFAPGETMRAVFVPLTNDAVEEPVKSFNVYLGRADSRGTAEPLSGMRVDLIDDD